MSTKSVEKKVQASTIAATLTPFVIVPLSRYVFHGDVPEVVSLSVDALITGGLTLAAGYFTRHVIKFAWLEKILKDSGIEEQLIETVLEDFAAKTQGLSEK